MTRYESRKVQLYIYIIDSSFLKNFFGKANTEIYSEYLENGYIIIKLKIILKYHACYWMHMKYRS